jgi:hypothetical protein
MYMYVRVDGYHEVDGSKSTDVVEMRALSVIRERVIVGDRQGYLPGRYSRAEWWKVYRAIQKTRIVSNGTSSG